MISIARRTFTGLLSVVVLNFAGMAHAENLSIEHIRVLETDDYFSEVNIDGVFFPPYAGSLLTFDRGQSKSASLEKIANGRVSGSVDNRKQFVNDPINMTYDVENQQLIILDEQAISVYSDMAAASSAASSVPDTAKATQFGIKSPVGIATDSADGTLYVLDQKGSRLTIITPEPSRGGEKSALRQQKHISRVDLQYDNSESLRGLAFNPASKKLYSIDTDAQQILGLDLTGATISRASFISAEWRRPEALVFAPSLDTTDDPSVWHLFIASTTGVSGEVNEWSVD